LQNIEIRKLPLTDIDSVVPLFDAYRTFYKQDSNIEAARAFLTERISNNESTIFLAADDNKGYGFAQVYPTFSSVSMNRVLILNDLYVKPEARRIGIAKKLMNAVLELAAEVGAVKIQLETSVDNHEAQQLYEDLGYKKDTSFYTYHLTTI
jgi:ribosomal protein S18 acetylase RimI-like enzyme